MKRNPLPPLALALLVPVQTAAAAGIAENGGQLAREWCSPCHIVAPDQTEGSAAAPTFHSIAEKYRDDVNVLAAFLADPHPPMPKLSLTRQEISDLIAYIGSLR